MSMAVAAVPENLTREQYVYMAKLAEQAERYEEMVKFMEKLVIGSTSAGFELTVEERNLLSVAYKNVIGSLRAAWRIVSSIEQKEEGRKNEEHVVLVKDYRSMVESELSDVCAGILKLLDSHLIPSASASESKVFYLKMKGDYHRYMAEFKVGTQRKEAAEDTMLSYKAAQDIAVADLAPTHPIRLGLALNFSVFYYEILNASEKACSMAKQEDVQLMVETGLEAYRFSISWSRLIPNGRGPVNPKGLDYYNNLINELVKHGIQPHATLMHIDVPQVLEDEYGGWLSRKMVGDFTAYAEVCFREFGDRVLHWTTVNEGNIFVIGGYDTGGIPPQRCSAPFGINCSKGNSSTEPYIAAHHILLAHSSAARLYKQKYQGRQQGFIGMNVYVYWPVPCTNATEDVIAAQRTNDFLIGWFMDPLVFGDYPDIMKKNAGTRLPAFTKIESEQVKGSFDFIGVNHYSTVYIKDRSSTLKMDTRDFNADMAIELIYQQGDTSTGELAVTPSGLLRLLEYFKQRYGNPPIYIHENGQKMWRNATCNDSARVKYLRGFLGSLLDAIRNGSNARGYFYWSFMDLLELLDGLESSYGLYYVDLNDKDLKRYPKLSAHWYSNFLKGKTIDGAIEVEQKINRSSTLSQSHSSQ